jgi:hypothetical protein
MTPAKTPIKVLHSEMAIRAQLAELTPGARWALMSNGFSQELKDRNEIVLARIPGGCVCCTGRISFKLALVALLRKGPFDGLIIHPQEKDVDTVWAILTEDQDLAPYVSLPRVTLPLPERA